VKLTGSTNADLLERAAQGAPEGLWLRADEQDGGRGRMGRKWQSPPGNLYASTIVRIAPTDPVASGLAFVTAVAVHTALSKMAPAATFMLKWPNDILVGGAKICGILLERQEYAVVAGIGVNLSHHPDIPDKPATSLTALGIAAQLPQVALEIIASEFALWLDRWRLGGLSPILAEWRKYAHATGAAIQANLPDGEIVKGNFEDVTDQGALTLRLADGSIRAIHAGDVILI
jgi:BirA family transcriptional regulator, biotin operon repressor / biotin---[acetyl-CoA-carboxylase] ligase